MKIRKIKNPNSLGWIVVLIVIVLLYASYYLIYIPQQEAKLKERGFRILIEYAQNIHDKHEHYKTHLENYSVYYSIRSQISKNSILKTLENKEPELLNEDSTSIINDIYGVIEYLNEFISTDSIDLNSTTSAKIFSLKDNLIYRTDDETFRKKFDETKNQSIGSVQIFDSLKFENVAKVPVSTLMEGLKFDKLFRNISLLNESDVLYNSNGSVVDDLTQNANLLDTLKMLQGGIILKLEINGVKNQVMILPIHFLDKDFYLAGFIPDKDFKKKTRTINSQFLTIIAGLLLLMLIGMPILKIIFINRKERLNVNDAHYATLSLILSLGILLLLFIGTIKYYIIDKIEAEKRIVKISARLTQNVENDFNELINLGDAIVSENNGNSELAKAARNILDRPPEIILNRGDEEKHVVPEYDIVEQRLLHKNFPINEVILIDSAGVATRAATSTVFSNLVPLNLSNRNYFKKHKNNESWDFEKNFATKFYIESIKSYNTGYQETAISFCLNTDTVFKTKAPFMAITSHIPALYDQVLPPDVLYVVIDKNGKVLFHSDPSKNLHENFLIESNDHAKLKAAVEFRTIENFKISYNEKDWLARIVPLENKPLYHVTLIDLQQTDDKNARIYLFTFYFLLFTFFCIWIGMQIIQRIRPKESFMDTKTWSFKWLLFHPNKLIHYQRLIIIQCILFLGQIIGLFFISKPVEMLVYQLIFIGFSGFVLISVLGKKKNKKASFFIRVIIVLSIVTVFYINNNSEIYPALILIVLLTFYLFFTLKKNSKSESNPKKTQHFYLAYMFVLLLCLTMLPVFSYYKTIDFQEEKLTEKNKMMDIADQNLSLIKRYNYNPKASWYKNITGCGLDGRTIKEITCKPSKESNNDFQKADSLYATLPGPNNGNIYLMPLLKKQNKRKEWSVFDSKKLKYFTAGTSTGICVTSSILAELNESNGLIPSFFNDGKILNRFLGLLIPILLLALLVWTLFKYLSDIILYTVLADWKIPNTPSWDALIDQNENNPVNKILLVSAKNNGYLKETECLYPTKVVTAKQITDRFFNLGSLNLKDTDKVIWIKDLEIEFLQIEKYDLIFEKLREIENIAGDRKIVIETPIDVDFIKEYFEDYILEYKIEKEEEIKILQSTRKLHLFLKDFVRFTGNIDRKSILAVFKNLNTENENEQNLLANAHLMKLQYYQIWNNLSRMEKMILFDLADDGMLNTKNKFLINRLKMKGLITIKPYPKIFTPSFKYFLKFSINQEETIQLENRLSKQGQWRNTKYLILLILIPLAALVFISQGTSIEKIIGIFTGVVALFSGALRLMDTNLFRTTTK